jgi:hypothetical protein
MVQERVSKLRNAVTGVELLPMGRWVPPSTADKGALLFYYLGSGQINDTRQFNVPSFTDPLAAGTVFMTSHQEFRIILNDPCGNPMAPIPLGSKDVTFTKDTDDAAGGTFKVTEQ